MAAIPLENKHLTIRLSFGYFVTRFGVFSLPLLEGVHKKRI